MKLVSLLPVFLGILYLGEPASRAQTTESAWGDKVSQELSRNYFQAAVSDARLATAQYP